ncbi:MAG: threonine-phosphate decarboxylase [Nitrospira sp.]|nr:threonine-phosphate decarboxylase [Nitrospira sp.]
MTETIFNEPGLFEDGGNIYRLAEELKIQERQVMDFSASANPLGVSKKIKAELRRHLKFLNNYPDTDTRRLRKRLSQYHGIDPETILCGNGSTELIHLTARALNPEKVLVTAPTYSGYERACKKSYELRVMSYELKRENNFEIKPEEFIAAMQGKQNSQLLTPNSELSEAPCDMAFLCNPNNPTGRLLKKEDVKRIAEAAKELKCYLIADEAFIDFCPEDSVIKYAGENPYLIVMRTMAHFHALSGLRIGYGVFPHDLVRRLRKDREPWTVNSLAQRAAVVALQDKAYRKDTFSLLKQEKRLLEKNFEKLGIEVFPSNTNFYLLRSPDAAVISRHLKQKGILVRDCSDFRGLDNSYMRVAVKSHKENCILIRELSAIMNRLR